MDLPIDKNLRSFGDVAVAHQSLRESPSFENRGTAGVCLGHGSRVSGGVLVVSKRSVLRKSGDWARKLDNLGVYMCIHRMLPRLAAYVHSNGEVRWKLSETEVPTMEYLVRDVEMTNVLPAMSGQPATASLTSPQDVDDVTSVSQ